MKHGSTSQCQVGHCPYQTDKPVKRTSTTAKSTRATPTEERGTSKRGKYTFEMRLALPTRLPLEPDRAAAKSCQGRSPARTSSG